MTLFASFSIQSLTQSVTINGSFTNSSSNSSTNSSISQNSQSSNSQKKEEPKTDKDANLIIKNEDFYQIPTKFDSALKIQKYLEKNKSLLASLSVETTLESDDPVIANKKVLPEKFNSQKILENYNKKSSKVLASQLIWDLSTTSLANGCSISSSKICLENDQKPINPSFLIALIQKESGLIYGKNAKLNPEKDDAKFLIERATGYYCMENEKSESCFDENPDWKYYKGFFRQVYFATRFLNLTSKRCEMGKDFGLRLEAGNHYIGNKLQISDIEIVPENGITCALYAFTPHIKAQKFFKELFEDIGK